MLEAMRKKSEELEKAKLTLRAEDKAPETKNQGAIPRGKRRLPVLTRDRRSREEGVDLMGDQEAHLHKGNKVSLIQDEGANHNKEKKAPKEAAQLPPPMCQVLPQETKAIIGGVGTLSTSQSTLLTTMEKVGRRTRIEFMVGMCHRPYHP